MTTKRLGWSPELVAHRASMKHLTVDAGQMAYLEAGPRTGPAVVLVHGMPTSSWLYRRVAARLADDGVRVVAPDLPGFGASVKPTDPVAYSLSAQAGRLALLLDHLELESAVFACHDLGGPWVFELADTAPQRIGGLVVLNTSAYTELMTPPREARLVGGPIGPVVVGMMGSRAGRAMIRKFIADFTSTGKALDRSVTDAYWLPLHEGGTRAFRAFAVGLDATMAEFARHAAALRRLDVPATLVWGTEDPVLRHELLVPRFVEDLRIADSDVHLLDHASHFLQEDRPDDIARHIASFVRTRVC